MPPPAQGQMRAEPAVYRTSGLRATVFSFVFLLLLPFFASLPAMIFMRAQHGRWESTAGLLVLAVAFGILMLLVLVELMYSIRTKIDVGESAVSLTLPTGRALVPMLSYRSHTVPYGDIKAIEARREIYGGALAPVLLRGARLVLKDDRKIQLGYINEANVDPAFPVGEIAERIATRAGLVVEDRGAVRRNMASKMMGFRSVDDGGPSIDEQTIADLNRRHSHVVVALVAALVLLVGAGIASDLLSSEEAAVVSQPAAKDTPKKK